MSISIINIKNSNLGSITGSSSSTNTDSTQCKSVYPTSAETKCSLPSSLVNVKSIQDISVSGSFNSLTEVVLRIDTDYSVSGNYLPNGKIRLAHLEGSIYVKLSGNEIVESSLSSVTIPNHNKVEALIPSSSCFNLNMQETVVSVQIPFSLTDRGTSLSGMITANIIEENFDQVIPC